MQFSLIRRIALLTLIAMGLILVLVGAPAWATGPWQPPQQQQPHHRAHDPCVPRVHTGLHSRGSDVPMRGERPASHPGCNAPHGFLHHLFHGERRR